MLFLAVSRRTSLIDSGFLEGTGPGDIAERDAPGNVDLVPQGVGIHQEISLEMAPFSTR